MNWPCISRRAYDIVVEERDRLRDGYKFDQVDLSMVRTMTWSQGNPYTREAWNRLLDKIKPLSAPHPLASLGEWLPNPVSCMSSNPWLPAAQSPCGRYSWCAGPKAGPPSSCPGCGSVEVV